MLAPRTHTPRQFATSPQVRRPFETTGFAFRLARSDDAPQANTAASCTMPATCGWVASAVGNATRRRT